MTPKVFVCFQTKQALNHYRDGKRSSQWELGGVFSTEQKAYNYAKKFWGFWIVQIRLNRRLPIKSVPLRGGYYPYEREREKEMAKAKKDARK